MAPQTAKTTSPDDDPDQQRLVALRRRARAATAAITPAETARTRDDRGQQVHARARTRRRTRRRRRRPGRRPRAARRAGPSAGSTTRAQAISTPTVAVRSQSSADWAAYQRGERGGRGREPHRERRDGRGVGLATQAVLRSGSRGRRAVDAAGRDQHRAGLDAGARPACGRPCSSSPSGVWSSGMPATPVWAAYSRATSTDVAPVGHHQVEHPGRTVHADRDGRGERVVRLRVGHDFPHDLVERRTRTGDVQASRWCAAHLSSTRPFGYG